MKMGEPGVPEMNAYIEEVLKEGETLGFDGRVVSVGDRRRLCSRSLGRRMQK